MDYIERNREAAREWFFAGGYKGMTDSEKVIYLNQECGYIEAKAWRTVYGE